MATAGWASSMLDERSAGLGATVCCRRGRGGDFSTLAPNCQTIHSVNSFQPHTGSLRSARVAVAPFFDCALRAFRVRLWLSRRSWEEGIQLLQLPMAWSLICAPKVAGPQEQPVSHRKLIPLLRHRGVTPGFAVSPSKCQEVLAAIPNCESHRWFGSTVLQPDRSFRSCDALFVSTPNSGNTLNYSLGASHSTPVS